MKSIKIVLVLQALFFAGWGTHLLTSHTNADVIWLSTEPVDPRDYLSGHYVQLSYSAARPEAKSCQELIVRIQEIHSKEARDSEKFLPSPRQVYVLFKKSTDMVKTEQGEVAIWKPIRCQHKNPTRMKADEVWARAYVSNVRFRSGFALSYGTERFYVPEGSPLRQARSGQVVAKLKRNRKHKLRIDDLVNIKKD